MTNTFLLIQFLLISSMGYLMSFFSLFVSKLNQYLLCFRFRVPICSHCRGWLKISTIKHQILQPAMLLSPAKFFLDLKTSIQGNGSSTNIVFATFGKKRLIFQQLKFTYDLVNFFLRAKSHNVNALKKLFDSPQIIFDQRATR